MSRKHKYADRTKQENITPKERDLMVVNETVDESTNVVISKQVWKLLWKKQRDTQTTIDAFSTSLQLMKKQLDGIVSFIRVSATQTPNETHVPNSSDYVTPKVDDSYTADRQRKVCENCIHVVAIEDTSEETALMCGNKVSISFNKEVSVIGTCSKFRHYSEWNYYNAEPTEDDDDDDIDAYYPAGSAYPKTREEDVSQWEDHAMCLEFGINGSILLEESIVCVCDLEQTVGGDLGGET